MAPFLKDCNIQMLWQKTGGIDADWTKEKITGWVEHAGGKIAFNMQLGRNTTHLVCSQQTWSKIAEGLIARFDGHEWAGKLHVVATKWLIDCLHQQKKLRLTNYTHRKLEDKKKARLNTNMNSNDDDDDDDLSNPADLFVKHSSRFVHKRDQEALQAKHDAEDAERAEVKARQKREEGLEREQEARIRRENAALIRRGIRKARNEIFSDEHHIYRDAEGFPYEVTLTKVDMSRNRNERATITIYESNAEPNTYATNLNRAGTGRQSTNNILVAIGASFFVARRLFVKSFEELTHRTWEDRLSTTSTSQTQDLSLDQRPFLYTPPAYGPKGDALYVKATKAVAPHDIAVPIAGNEEVDEKISVIVEAINTISAGRSIGAERSSVQNGESTAENSVQDEANAMQLSPIRPHGVDNDAQGSTLSQANPYADVEMTQAVPRTPEPGMDNVAQGTIPLQAKQIPGLDMTDAIPRTPEPYQDTQPAPMVTTKRADTLGWTDQKSMLDDDPDRIEKSPRAAPRRKRKHKDAFEEVNEAHRTSYDDSFEGFDDPPKATHDAEAA